MAIGHYECHNGLGLGKQMIVAGCQASIDGLDDKGYSLDMLPDKPRL
jgi:hypothetical protein